VTAHPIPREFPVLRWELTRNRLSRFSAACGMSRSDGTIHDDDEGAMAVGLPAPIGYGMLSATILSRAITDVIGAGNVRRLSTRFVNPSLIGETLETHVTAEDVARTEHAVRANLRCLVTTTTGEERVRGTASVVIATSDPLGQGEQRRAARHDAHGPPDGASIVVVERGPVSNFANSADETNPEYFEVDVARSHHHRDIPAPPTFGLGPTLEYWGKWPELQPGRMAPDAMTEATATLERLAGPGLVLHAGQLFDYRRPIYVGDLLIGTSTTGEPRTVDGKGGRLTFLEFESRWSDYRTGEGVMTSCMTLVAPRAQ
jgi:acyl dehydratase